MRRQHGQTLVLVALLSTVLIGFVGLVIDGGEVAAQQQLVQSAADGAALAGVYQVGQPGATTASATTLAQAVIANLGLPSGDLALSFLDAGGAATTTPAAVAVVRAVVTDSQSTYFLKVVGIGSARATGRASASPRRAPCALCVLGLANTTVDQVQNSTVDVSGGGAIIDSRGTANLSLGDSATFTAPSVTIAGGSYVLGPQASISPVPSVGPAAPDPFPLLSAPSVAGAARAYSSPGSGSGSLAPGVYSSITVNGSYSLRLSPGIFVLTGPLVIAGGDLTASGVLLYLGCASYPVGCAAPTASCGRVDTSGGPAVLSAPTTGPYARLAIFADRRCTGANPLGDQTVVTGTAYLPAMAVAVQDNSNVTFNGALILGTLSVGDSAGLAVSYVATQNYVSLGLSL